MDTKKLAAVQYAYNSSQKSKRILIYVTLALFFIILLLIIGIYIKIFENNEFKDTLFLALEEQEIALEVSDSFVNLLTYYPKEDGHITGYFMITNTVPSADNFIVTDKNGNTVSTKLIKSIDRSKPSFLYFSSTTGGALTIKYTNTNSQNYLIRIDVVLN